MSAKRPLFFFLLFLLSMPCARAADGAPSYVELQDAPTITVDWSKGNTQAVTLGGDRELSFINGRKGGRYLLIIKQDATGGRRLSWPKSVEWPGDNKTPFALTTLAHKKDFVTFFFDGATYDALAIAQDY